jgi:mRNA interferase MazF
MSVEPTGDERVVVTYIARTTSIRGTQFEVAREAPGFLPGVFDAQSIGTVPAARLVKKIGAVDPGTMENVESALRSWLRL